MSDWFENLKEKVIYKIANETGVDDEKVRLIYKWLSDFGLIDYDLEKDIFQELDEEE